MLAAVASQLVEQGQRHEDHRQKLAEYPIDPKHQGPRQNEQRQRHTIDIGDQERDERNTVQQRVVANDQDELGIIIGPGEWDERDVGELQRQGQEELEPPSPVELEYEGVYADQKTKEVQQEYSSLTAIQKGGSETDFSAPKDQLDPAQTHITQEDRARNDEAQGGRQADEIRELVPEHKGVRQGGGAYRDDISENLTGKRRFSTEYSDKSAELRAKQLWEGRKAVGMGKYQRLNRFESSDADVGPEDNTLFSDR